MSLAIRKVIIPSTQRIISQGQNIQIMIQITDSGIIDQLIDPISTPLIDITNPSNSLIVTNGLMTRISKGLFKYIYQTTPSDTKGVYTANFTVFNGNAEAAKLESLSIFNVAQLSTFVTFNYIQIKDQSSVSHYLYITEGLRLVSSLTVPVIAGFQGISVTPTVVPFWIELSSISDATALFIYPDTLGERYIINTSAPVTGTGFDSGSQLQLIGLIAKTYTLRLVNRLNAQIDLL